MENIKLSEASYEQLVDELVKRFGIIRHIWNIEDIKAMAKDRGFELSNLQISRIVKDLENISCNDGITYETIDYVINQNVK